MGKYQGWPKKKPWLPTRRIYRNFFLPEIFRFVTLWSYFFEPFFLNGQGVFNGMVNLRKLFQGFSCC